MSRYHRITLDRRQAWLALGLAIVCEVAATLSTKASDGLTRPVPAAGALVGFALTTLLLGKVLEVIPTSIAYTVWTGVGSAAVVVLGVVLFGDHVTLRSAIGVGFVVAGVVALNRPERAPET